MLISLGIVPMVPDGTQNRLTCFSFPLCHRRYCCSENSCAPPPVPRIIPISRFSSTDIAFMSRPASATAAVVAATQRGTTRERCLRSRASTQASSSNSGISPPMCTSRFDESNRVICFTPDLPASTARQKSCLPMPFGLTTPIPVITTRGSMNEIQLSWNALVTTNSRQPPYSPAVHNHTDASGPLHRRAILPDEVHLLQLRLRCILARCVRKLRFTPVR